MTEEPNVITYTPEQTAEMQGRARRRAGQAWALAVEFDDGMQYELAEQDTMTWSRTSPWSELSVQYESTHQRIRIIGPRQQVIGLLSTYPALHSSAQIAFAPHAESPADEAPEWAIVREAARRLGHRRATEADDADGGQAIGSTPVRTGGPIACTMPDEAG